MKRNCQISVVIPVYGCRSSLKELYAELQKVLQKITDHYEIIMVNDACPQNSWETIQELAEKDNALIGINLSRNFGQIKAITAGLEHAKGENIVVMDCDLQDKPEKIINLYNKLQEGYDVVFARRIQRKHNVITRITSKAFYKIYSWFTDTGIDSSVCNFSISKKQVISSYLTMREQNRAFVLFIKWMGFYTTAIDIDHNKRETGKSSYSFRKKILEASKIITAQSNKPLLIFISFGFIISFLSFFYGVVMIIRHFINDVNITGWTTLIVAITFLCGIILINLGVIGLYIGYIFNEMKKRPLYIIKNKINT